METVTQLQKIIINNLKLDLIYLKINWDWMFRFIRELRIKERNGMKNGTLRTNLAFKRKFNIRHLVLNLMNSFLFNKKIRN